MLGYPLKEYGNRWCHTVFQHNMSTQRLLECRDAHQAIVGYNVFKRRQLLQPTGWFDFVIKYEQLFCFPLSVTMHTVHILRFMLLDGKYAFSPKWLDASAGAAVDQRAAQSYRQIVNLLRLNMGHVFVHDVYTLLNRGRSTTGNHENFEGRDTDFDSMSLQRMKMLTRAARRLLARTQAARMDDHQQVELALLQMPRFEIEDLEIEIAGMGADIADEMPRDGHPAAGLGGVLEDDVPDGVEGELMSAEAEAIAFSHLDPNAEEEHLDRIGDVSNRLQDLDVEEAE